MPEVILTAKLDSTSVAEQLRKAESQAVQQKKQIFEKEKVSLDIATKRLQIETRINKLYIERLRLQTQISSKELSFMGKMRAQAGLATNAVATGVAASQYQRERGASPIEAAAIGAGIGSSAGASAGSSAQGQIQFGSRPGETYQMGGYFMNTRPFRAGYAFGRSRYARPAMYALRRTQRFFGPAIRSMGGAFGSLLNPVTKALGAGALAVSAFNQGNEIYEGARGLGMSTDAYQRYGAATERSGMGSIEDIYGRYQSTREKALAGDITSKTALSRLGVSDLNNANNGFAQLMSTLKNGAQDTNSMRAALEIFGDATSKVVNGMKKFTEVFDSFSSMPDNVVTALKEVKDTFGTTLKEVVTGVGIMLAALKPLAKLLNLGKSGIAGLGAMAGSLYEDYFGSGQAKGALGRAVDAGAAAAEAYKAAQTTPTLPASRVVDPNAIGRSLPAIPDIQSFMRPNRFQQSGLFIGGAPVAQLNDNRTMNRIADYTKQTADNTAATAQALK